MNVLVISRYFHPFIGGNEKQCLLLSTEIAKRNNIVTVVAGRHTLKLRRKEIINGLNVYRIKYINILYEFDRRTWFSKIYNGLRFFLGEWSFMMNLFLFLIIRGRQFQIIHIHKANWIVLPCILYSKFINKPIIVKEATFKGPSEMKLLLIPYFIQNLLFKEVNFVAISTEIKKYLISKNVVGEKIAFIPNGIVLPKIIEYERRQNEVLFVGNIWSRTVKGLDILLQAFTGVISNIPDAKLIIIGDGNPNLFNEYYNQIILNKNVFFLGKKNDLSLWYRKSTIYVSPSRSEGLSNSLIEAMAYCMPCIATNISGSNDLIISGQNGFLVEPNEVGLLRSAIVDLLSNNFLQQKFGYNARVTIKQNYQIQTVADQYIQLYEKLSK